MEIVKQIYPSVTIQRQPPKGIKAGDERLFGGPDFSYAIPASNILFYRKVFVTHHGIIIKNIQPQQKLIVCYEHDFKKYRYRYLFHVFLKNKRVNSDKHKKYILIFDNYSGPSGFAHWISDGLTRLIEIKDQMNEFTALVPYYFKIRKIYEETLDLFGIVNRLYMEKNTYLHIDNLYVPQHIAGTGSYLPANVDKLRKFVWSKNIHQLKFSLGKRIYISRAKAAWRFVINENEVIQLMEESDFETVFMEDYAFAEQVSIIYNADFVVSIHGAGLALEHFMKEGSHVLEFRKRGDNLNNIYYHLADALGIKYFYQECDFVNTDRSGNFFNLSVDLEELKNNLQLMLK